MSSTAPATTTGDIMCCEPGPYCDMSGNSFLAAQCDPINCIDTIGCLYIETETPCDPPQGGYVLYTFYDDTDCGP